MLNRQEIPDFLNDNNLTGYGAEIGVFKGEFSAHILKNWKGKKLYLIDSWRHFENRIDISNVDLNQQLNNMACAFMNVYEYADKATIIRDLSGEAVKLFLDSFFDFIYIDAGHDYNSVITDLNYWYSKVKIGGYVMGHDYLDSTYVLNDNMYTKFEVKSAVDAFAFSKCLDVKNITENL